MIAWILPLFNFFMPCLQQPTDSFPLQEAAPLHLADPTIFAHKDTFYLTGTGAGRYEGFQLFWSTDLEHWKRPLHSETGMAFMKGDGYGDKGFWAPQIFEYQKRFYLAYTANEQIAIAVADHPAGPYRQEEKKALYNTGKQIDPFLFRDTDGTIYMYFVKLQEGNRLFVGKMKDDLSDIIPSTIQPVLSAELPWENTQNAKWPVTEGPTVIRKGKTYFLFYSANDYRNIDYAVGYATSKHPMGPWTKVQNQPLISRANTALNGSGHGDLFQTKNGQFYYVFHAHQTNEKVQPRKTVLTKLRFNKRNNSWSTDANSIKVLTQQP